jgi:molybdate transport system substrate-binding protein
MSMAVSEIARNYTRDRQVGVNASFAPATMQQAQINEGADADILITPLEPWIEQLKLQGLVDIHSQSVVATNRLALVGPADSTLSYDPAQGFPANAIIRQLGGEPGFVIGNPETLTEGVYGKESLRKLGVAADLEPYTLYIKQLDSMFDMVDKHQAYGLFFYSSTIGRDGLRVLGLLPETAHRPINYYAVVIAGSNMDEARKFVDYLRSSAARRVFRDNGFGAE